MRKHKLRELPKHEHRELQTKRVKYYQPSSGEFGDIIVVQLDETLVNPRIRKESTKEIEKKATR